MKKDKLDSARFEVIIAMADVTEDDVMTGPGGGQPFYPENIKIVYLLKRGVWESYSVNVSGPRAIKAGRSRSDYRSTHYSTYHGRWYEYTPEWVTALAVEHVPTQVPS